MFKVGDRVRSKTSGDETVVELIPGMSEYDKRNFLKAEKGFVTKEGYWDFWDSYELVTGKRGRPRTKPAPVNFLLKYDLDKDPIEEYETMEQVKDRIKVLSERSDLKRDSIVVYEIKRKKMVSIETKIKFK